MKNNMEKPIVKGSSVVPFLALSWVPVGSIVLAEIMVGDVMVKTPFFAAFFIALECLNLMFVLNFYKFYKEYVEIYSPMRIGKKRKRKIHYSEIVRVVYRDRPSRDHSQIRIYGIGKKYRFSNFGNTVYSIPLKRTIVTLKLLKSKDIPIEIIASNRRKKKILEQLG
jgi:hypothetical protein